MKKALLTGLLLVVCYQCSGMYSDALGSKNNFDKNEKGSLRSLQTNRIIHNADPLVQLRADALRAGEDGIINWIVSNTSLIKGMRILTADEALQLLNALESREKTDQAREIANKFKEKLINPTTSQNSMLPQISVSEEDETVYEKLSHEADLLEEQEYKLAKVAYEVLIKAFNRAIKQKEESMQALLETLVNQAIKEAQQEVKAKRKSATTEESKESKTTTVTMQELVPSNPVETQQYATPKKPKVTQSTEFSSIQSSLPGALETITEGNEEEFSSEETTDSEETSPSTSGSTSMSSSTSITPRSSSPSITLGISENYSQANPEELQAIIVDERKDTVIPIEITSGSKSYFGGMPISGQPQLPRVRRDLEEFKFLSPFAGASGQQLGSQRPQTPAQKTRVQKIRELLQSNVAEQKTMAEEKKS